MPMKETYISLNGKDLLKWFEASFFGLLGCMLLYTFFGMFLVHAHADIISSEMHLFISNHMLPVIMPDDIYLKGFSHQLGSALFFGLTLGPLTAILASAASISPWIKGHFSKMDIFICVMLICIYLFLTFSKEMPLVSIVSSILTPAFFFIPWIYAVKYRGATKKRHRPPLADHRRTRWIVFALILLTPLVLFKGTSFIGIRDAMIDMPVLNKLSDFYYNHTLLAAHVIKPILYQTQKVIAITKDTGKIWYSPHGSLWIRTKDPCSIKGRIMAVSKRPVACSSIIVSKKGLVTLGNRVIRQGSEKFDNNRSIRKAVGVFLKGPVVLIPIFVILWLALWLASLFEHHKTFAILLVTVYLIGFIPHMHYMYLTHSFNIHKENVHMFAASDNVKKRYIALRSHSKEFTRDELSAFATDPVPGIRLNAYIIMGKRKYADLIGLLEKGTRDPQLNVRTKACEALGQIGNTQALSILEKVADGDPSWYVRNYAYRAIGRIRPVFKVVDE